MKRFMGLVLMGLGTAGTLSGGYHVLIGESSNHISITHNFAITALVGGLAGVACLSIGFVWMRD